MLNNQINPEQPALLKVTSTTQSTPGKLACKHFFTTGQALLTAPEHGNYVVCLLQSVVY